MRHKGIALFLAALLVLTAAGCGLMEGSGSASADSGTSAAEEAAEGEASLDEAGADDGKTARDGDKTGTGDAAETGETDEDAETSEPEAPRLTRQIDSTDGTMRLFIPENWSDMSGSFETAGLSAADLDARYPLKAACYEEASFLIATSEKKDGTPIADLQDYMNTLFKGVTQSSDFSDVQVGQYIETTLNKSGLTAYRRDFTARYGDKMITCWLYAIEGGSRYYQLMAWTTSGNVLTAGPLFESIAASFEEIAR